MEKSEKNSKKPNDPRSNRRHGLSGDQGVKYATGQGDVGNQASPGNNNTTGRKNIQLRNKIRIGTWNVRGLLKDGKLKILESELERCNSTITGISETHWRDSGHFDTGKYTIYYSGNDNSFAGVAIAIPKQWNSSVLGYNPVNDRIISIKLNASPISINIIQVYAPTSAADDDVVETFYNQLETCMSQVPKREILIVLGDFNAKIGSTRFESSLRHIVGPYGLGTRNDRGERLFQFAADNNLTIMNTVFKHHPRRLYVD